MQQHVVVYQECTITLRRVVHSRRVCSFRIGARRVDLSYSIFFFRKGHQGRREGVVVQMVPRQLRKSGQITMGYSSSSIGGSWLSADQKQALESTASAMCTRGKGITACDESPGTISMRLEAVGLTNSEEIRRQCRQMLFETVDCEKYLSAAILDPETLYQTSSISRETFPSVLAA